MRGNPATVLRVICQVCDTSRDSVVERRGKATQKAADARKMFCAIAHHRWRWSRERVTRFLNVGPSNRYHMLKAHAACMASMPDYRRKFEAVLQEVAC